MIVYAKVPIVIICKDRISYLDSELRSLSATCPSSTHVIISNDGTKNESMVRYLTTNESIEVKDCGFPENHPEWVSVVGQIPIEKVVTGVLGKVSTLMHPVSAGTKNLGKAVKYAFSLGASHVVKMEDDLIFTEGWYRILLQAALGSGCDLVSGFRYFYGKAATRKINEETEEVQHGYTGGQLMICSRKYYNSCPHVFNNEITTIWDNDDLWINQCRAKGLKFGVTTRSLCQHVGFQTESKQKAFVKNGRLHKVDRLVKPSQLKLSLGVKQFADK